MATVNGAWVLGLGDTSPEIRKIKAFMRVKFASYAGGLADAELLDHQLVTAVTEMQRGYGIAPTAFTGTIGYTLKVKMGYLRACSAAPQRVLFTVNGTGASMWDGYQAEIAGRWNRRGCTSFSRSATIVRHFR
jgi:hypothetical protein